MKKLFIALVAVFTLGTANAQIQDLGVRGAFEDKGFAGELSAMWGMGGNRLETDLGWSNSHGDYLNLTCIYQWTWDLGSDFGWFAGVGANLGIRNNAPKSEEDGIGLGFDCQIGLEFNPSAIPFQFTLDFRPMWHFIGYSGFGYAGAIGIRYRF